MSPFFPLSQTATLTSPSPGPKRIKKGDLFRVLSVDDKKFEVRLVAIDRTCLSPKEQEVVGDEKHERINRVRKAKMRELRKRRKES